MVRACLREAASAKAGVPSGHGTSVTIGLPFQLNSQLQSFPWMTRPVGLNPALYIKLRSGSILSLPVPNKDNFHKIDF